MKYLFISVIVFSAYFSDIKKSSFEFSETLEMNELISKDEIVSGTCHWFIKKFGQSPFVTECKNDISHLSGKGRVIIGGNSLYAGFVEFSVDIFIKSGKLVYIVSNLSHIASESEYSGGTLDNVKPECGYMCISKRKWIELKEKTKKEIHDIFVTLPPAMEKQSIEW